MLIELGRTFLAWILIFPAAFSLGAFFDPLIRSKDNLVKGILLIAIGLAILSYSVVFLSFFHLLRHEAIWILLVILAGIRIHKFKELRIFLREAIKACVPKPGKSAALRILECCFTATFFALLAGTLAPEVGGDALAYQLNLPKDFLLRGSVAPVPYDYNSYFPLLMNNLYLVGLATGGMFAARLFHFLTGLLLFLSVKHVIDQETKNQTLAYFLALVFWVTPAVYNNISTTYIDGAVALYTFLSFFVFLETLKRMDTAGFFLSGFLMGCTLAVKYLGLLSAVGLMGCWIYACVKQRRFFNHVKAAGVWLLGLFLMGGYWYLRNWMFEKNPFFPYFGHVFNIISRPSTDHHTIGMGRNVFSFVSIFWNMFFSPQSFGSFTSRIGPFYFLLFPFLLLASVTVKKSRPYAAFFFSFLFAWFLVIQYDRFFITVLPMMAIASAYGIQWFYESASADMKRLCRRVGWILMVPLFIDVAAGVYHYRFTYPLFVGLQTPEEYLRKLERSAPVAFWINDSLSEGAHILIEGDPRRFYIKRKTTGEAFLRWRTHYEETHKTPEALRNFVKSLGVTHLLTSEVVSPFRNLWRSPMSSIIGSSYAKKIKVVTSENIRDEIVRYSLYEIV